MTNGSKNVLQRGLENIHDPFSNFIRAQTTSSLFLLVATIAALWWANSAYSSTYQNLIHTPIGFFVGEFELRASLKHIINDGLMVIFFFLLGLEIKREVLAGDLAQPENRRMLILCAVGGMICPAVIYSLFNWSLDSQIGWGIPMATDTAFALGVLTIVRKHIPVSLLAFIVGLAIVDDVGCCNILYARNICNAPVKCICAYCVFGSGQLRRRSPADFLYFHRCCCVVGDAQVRRSPHGCRCRHCLDSASKTQVSVGKIARKSRIDNHHNAEKNKKSGCSG